MVKQRWKCPICGYKYDSPISVSEARCPKPHTSSQLAALRGTSQKTSGRSGLALMDLIEGSPPRSSK